MHRSCSAIAHDRSCRLCSIVGGTNNNTKHAHQPTHAHAFAALSKIIIIVPGSMPRFQQLRRAIGGRGRSDPPACHSQPAELKRQENHVGGTVVDYEETPAISSSSSANKSPTYRTAHGRHGMVLSVSQQQHQQQQEYRDENSTLSRSRDEEEFFVGQDRADFAAAYGLEREEEEVEQEPSSHVHPHHHNTSYSHNVHDTEHARLEVPTGLSVDSTDTQELILRQQREQQGLYGPMDPVASKDDSADCSQATFAEIFNSSSEQYDEHTVSSSAVGAVGQSPGNFVDFVLEEAHNQSMGPTNSYDDTSMGHMPGDTFSSGGDDNHFLTSTSNQQRQTSVHIRGRIDSDEFQQRDYDDEGALEYLDSEEQAFTFGSEEEEDQTQFAAPADMHQLIERNPEEVTTYAQETDCSNTLNTNTETLHTNLEGVNYIPMNNHSASFHVHASYINQNDEGESYIEEYEGQDGEYRRNSLQHIGSYLYEDDGFIHYQEDATEFGEEGTFITGAQGEDDDNTFQETLTTDFESSGRDEGRIVDGHGNTEMLSQLMDSYLSDRSSTCSSEEGSFAGGASRTISRVDSADNSSYDSDGEITRKNDRTLMSLFKKFRDMNLPSTRNRSYDDEDEDEDDGEYSESDDEDEHAALPDVAPTESSNSNSYHSRQSLDKKKRRSSGGKRNHRRQPTKEIGEMFHQIGSMSMDFLHEALEKQKPESSSKKGRRRSKRDRKDPTTGFMDSLQDIFSCGAPRGRYA